MSVEWKEQDGCVNCSFSSSSQRAGSGEYAETYPLASLLVHGTVLHLKTIELDQLKELRLTSGWVKREDDSFLHRCIFLQPREQVDFASKRDSENWGIFRLLLFEFMGDVGKSGEEISGQKDPRPRKPRSVLTLGNQRQRTWVRERQSEDQGHETKHRVLGVRKDDFRIAITLVAVKTEVRWKQAQGVVRWEQRWKMAGIPLQWCLGLTNGTGRTETLESPYT